MRSPVRARSPVRDLKGSPPDERLNRLLKEPAMRIAQIAPPWFPVPPDGYGGTERVVALLADGLTSRGHEVTLFASGGSRSRARIKTPMPVAPDPETLG